MPIKLGDKAVDPRKPAVQDVVRVGLLRLVQCLIAEPHELVHLVVEGQVRRKPVTSHLLVASMFSRSLRCAYFSVRSFISTST